MREEFVGGGDCNDDGRTGISVGLRYFDKWTPLGHGGDAEEYRMENPLGVPTKRRGAR
jgi:hypothetical protein